MPRKARKPADAPAKSGAPQPKGAVDELLAAMATPKRPAWAAQLTEDQWGTVCTIRDGFRAGKFGDKKPRRVIRDMIEHFQLPVELPQIPGSTLRDWMRLSKS